MAIKDVRLKTLTHSKKRAIIIASRRLYTEVSFLRSKNRWIIRVGMSDLSEAVVWAERKRFIKKQIYSKP